MVFDQMASLGLVRAMLDEVGGREVDRQLRVSLLKVMVMMLVATLVVFDLLVLIVGGK